MSELTDRLLPCPGCGRNVGAPHDDEGDGIYFVDCAHCGWRGPRAYNLTDAWNRWQRRAAASTSTEGAGVKATHRHMKRGSEYVLIGYGKMQAERWEIVHELPSEPIEKADMAPVAIYRSVDDGSLWVRPVAEFEDGRFVALNPPASKVTDEAEERG